MILYINQSIDEKTFRRLRAIARAYDFDIKKKRIKEAFDLPKSEEKSFIALNRLDAMNCIYKGLQRLKDFADQNI